MAASIQGPQRSLASALVVALAGLCAAAAALFHPVDRSASTLPPGDVALVNREPILMSDFINEVGAIAGQPFAATSAAQRVQVLHDMVDEELVVQRGLALDLPEQDTAVRTAIVDSVNALVAAPVLAQSSNDDELQSFYAAHRANYATEGSMTLTDLVMHVGGFESPAQTTGQALADAEQAAYELRSGAALNDVMQHFGLVDSGKISGLEADFAARTHLGPKLYAAAQALGDGEVSEPIADSDGVHVLVMQHRQAPVFTDFNAVRNNVYNDYVRAEQAQAAQANLTSLRRKAQIVLAPGQSE